MMDAGIPVKETVAGIAMGLIKEEDKILVLSDIIGAEDHYGDMDFKVTGTRHGITAIQMDLKIQGISAATMRSALEQARLGRLHIIDVMERTISQPARENFGLRSAYADYESRY
jgi:polyribonucleotide nucleotidyltransferase